MGDYADMMLDGTFCEGCGTAFDDCETPGYPRRCGGCQRDAAKLNRELRAQAHKELLELQARKKAKRLAKKARKQ